MEGPGLKTEITSGEHALGFRHAPVTLVMYGDYESPQCARAQGLVDRLMKNFGSDLRFVYRHFPTKKAHARAERAAKAAEAAYGQGRFWEMHRLLFESSAELNETVLTEAAAELGLNVVEFKDCIESSHCGTKVKRDVESGIRSGVDEAPAFLINDSRYLGLVEFEALRDEIQQKLDEETIRRAI